MRALLIQMPFHMLDTPSISLSNLRSALEAKGFACDIKYLNTEFGKLLGADLHNWIAAKTPTTLLFGDLIFAPILHDRRISSDQLRKLTELQRRSNGRDRRSRFSPCPTLR